MQGTKPEGNVFPIPCCTDWAQMGLSEKMAVEIIISFGNTILCLFLQFLLKVCQNEPCYGRAGVSKVTPGGMFPLIKHQHGVKLGLVSLVKESLNHPLV